MTYPAQNFAVLIDYLGSVGQLHSGSDLSLSRENGISSSLGNTSKRFSVVSITSCYPQEVKLFLVALASPSFARILGCVIIILVEINVLVESGLGDCLEVDWLQDIAQRVLRTQGLDSRTEVDLVIADQGKVQALNRQYLGRDRPTDVIAFPLHANDDEGQEPSFVLPPDGVTHLGEVIISYPQAVTQAGELGHSVKKEVAILIIHGVLHLLGYRDDEPELKRRMMAKQGEILSVLEGEVDF
jgi:probable rRNA maturation factor